MRKITKSLFSRLYNRIEKWLPGALASILLIAFAGSMMIAVEGCAFSELASLNKKEKKPKEIKIAVCVHNEYEEHVWNIVNHMSQWARDKEKETGIKITLDTVGAKGSQLIQNEQVEKFVAKDYDLLCVNLVDRTDPTEIIERAMDADIPVIFFNRELVKEDLDRWDKLFYVGAYAEQAGRLQAQIIISAFQDEKKKNEIDVNHNDTLQYVMLEGEPGHQDALIRTRVVTEALQEAGISIEKLGAENANWDEDQAKTKMKALIERYPFQIEAVIANDDVMALGVLDALEEADYPNKPLVVGVNGSERALEAIRSGKMAGSVLNDAKGQGNAIMELAYSLVTGEEMPLNVRLKDGKYIYLNYKKITYDNVFEFIEEE